MPHKRPLIGLTVGAVLQHTGMPYFGLNKQYVTALVEAGATPVLLAAGSLSEPADLLENLDGMVFPGGLDVHPSLYGEEPSSLLGRVDGELDALDIPLVRVAVRRKLPVLGLCRGHQLVNVALGGTLYQDIRGDGASSENHWAPLEDGRDHIAHSIDLVPGTLLSQLAGAQRVKVNSFHHQAVKDVAADLKVNAYCASDHVIEGLESEDGRVLTVQSHPEALVHTQSWARRLFKAFVNAAASGSEIRPATEAALAS